MLGRRLAADFLELSQRCRFALLLKLLSQIVDEAQAKRPKVEAPAEADVPLLLLPLFARHIVISDVTGSCK